MLGFYHQGSKTALFVSEGFRNLSSQNIWDHLETFFNLEKADLVERRSLDSPDEIEFDLPLKDFADAITSMKKGFEILSSEYFTKRKKHFVMVGRTKKNHLICD